MLLQLYESIGQRTTLYLAATNAIYQMYVQTGHPRLCTLRMDLFLIHKHNSNNSVRTPSASFAFRCLPAFLFRR